MAIWTSRPIRDNIGQTVNDTAMELCLKITRILTLHQAKRGNFDAVNFDQKFVWM